MKIFFTSDLHIGHTINLIDREEEFKKLFEFLIQNAKKADIAVISGDIFDSYFPSTSALKLYYDFLLSLSKVVKRVIIIGGNHDSFKTLLSAKEVLKVLNVEIVSGAVDDYMRVFDFEDFSLVAVSYLREAILKDKSISQIYQEGFEKAKRKRVFATGHLNVLNSKRSSERDIYIGGIEGVEVEIFKDFDLVLMGHLHRPQKIKNVLYAGSPLQLSFDEDYQKKVFIIDSKTLDIEEIKVPKFKNFVKLVGSFEEVKEKLKDVDGFVEIELKESIGPEKLKELKMQKVVKVLLDYEEEVKDVISFEEMMKQFLKDDEYEKFLEIQKEVENEIEET